MFKLKAKQLFFDAPKVIKALEGARRKALAKAGAFIRSDARRSLRRAKGPSAPGRPPHSHNQQLLKRWLLFAYDPTPGSVFIGPVRLSDKPDETPELMEHGGFASNRKRRLIVVPGTGRRGRKRRALLRQGQRLAYKPRPFMQPALLKNVPKLPALWRDSITPK
jgi:hypothetical protein